jgi:NADH-quinone oxidoreductase subunit C
VIKVDLPRDKPQVPSLASLWKSADWNEREQFDLFGVEFIGHPDLRRIMMPDDWVGYPCRKDYKEADSYRGMPTTRPNTLELLPLYDKAPPEEKHPKPTVVPTELEDE